MIKADLHIHTTFSGDSEISPEKLIERVREAGLGCIAVTDHDTAAGGLKVAGMKPPFKVIVGEEIDSNEGEIIGLFLKETIAHGLSPEETISLIHRQGGLAYIPHPFDRFRSSAMQRRTLERIAGIIDAVETANARTLPVQDLSLPGKFALEMHKPMGAGSDSHTLEEIGRAYIEIDDFDNPESFIEALKKGKIHPYHASAAAHLSGMVNRIARKVSRSR